MRIEKANVTHLDSIYDIEIKTFSDAWSKNSIKSAMESEPCNIFLALDDDNTVIGYIFFYLIDEEAEILNLAVIPEKRRMGIASSLLKYSFEIMKKNGVRNAYLDVRKSNIPALSLYKSFNFEQLTIRKNYYTKPVEDAIDMCLCLDNEEVEK